MSKIIAETQEIEFKAINGALSIDEAKGIVECFVAAVGNKDSVGDIIIPGAFDESLKRRKPRVVWGHDWNQPIGKVLDIFEVSNADSRLPAKMRAAGVGGLFARVQFNLKSERGREAFSNIVFFGEDQEWSIGYKTHDAVYDNAKQANILKTLELYEVSPVLHGANQLTATISVKSDNQKNGDYMGSELAGISPVRRPLAVTDEAVVDTASDEESYPKRVGEALAKKFGGMVRLRELDKNMVVFDLMNDGQLKTIRLSYHFDGSLFMFGDPEVVKPTTVYLPDSENEDDSEDEPMEQNRSFGMEDMKAGPGDVPLNPTNAVPDAIPQERFTGDVLRGRGPRRGNLERLLRYWRPIMKREGGFRRCRVILADHPELYPLNNMCAWLHHETTGLWPNEGCHHPGMKNCRNKLKKGTNGSLISDSAFNTRMRELAPGKSAMMDQQLGDNEEYGDITDEDIAHANKVLQQFAMDEKDFMGYLADPDNWEHVGDSDEGMDMGHEWMKPKGDCGCGGGCGKSAEDDLDFKAGRSISGSNMGKLEQAIVLLQQVVAAQPNAAIEMKKKDDIETIINYLSPVLNYHGIKVDNIEGFIRVKNIDEISEEAVNAFNTAMFSFSSKDDQ